MRDKFPTGFTLIELLIAITIIVTIFTFGYVSYHDFTRRQVLTDAVSTLRADLQLVQQKAASGEKPSGCTNTLHGYIVRFEASETGVYADCNNIVGYDITDVSVKSIILPNGIVKTGGVNEIIFNTLGRGVSADTTITLTQTSSGRTATITITRGGSIY